MQDDGMHTEPREAPSIGLDGGRESDPEPSCRPRPTASAAGHVAGHRGPLARLADSYILQNSCE